MNRILKELKREKLRLNFTTVKTSFDFRADLYQNFKEKCKKNELSVRRVLERLMEEVLSGDI